MASNARAAEAESVRLHPEVFPPPDVRRDSSDLQALAKLRQALGRVRRDRPARHPESGRGLLLREADQIARSEHLPLAHRQPSHLAQELRAFAIHLGRAMKQGEWRKDRGTNALVTPPPQTNDEEPP